MKTDESDPTESTERAGTREALQYDSSFLEGEDGLSLGS